MKNKCITIKKCKFLWHKWEEENTEHDWIYFDKEHRKCKKCGKKQIYFGLTYNDTLTREDWRDAFYFEEKIQ